MQLIQFMSVGWLIGFYPQGPGKWIFVSSKAHVSPPTRILSDQGNQLVVRQGCQTQVTCTEGKKLNRCSTDLTQFTSFVYRTVVIDT